MAYKLLLADDSITIQKVVELTLSEEGFDVTAVGDGVAAFEAAGKIKPDIILADVFMPRMDGYELCEKIRADAALSGIPVMLLSGTFEEFDEIRASRVGANDNLTKPFESSELINRVRALVESAPAAPAAPPAKAAAAPAAAPVEAMAAESVDDLWSVVDMASDNQPLAGATEILEEEDLWKRANLVGEQEEVAEAAIAEEEGIPFGELDDEPFEAEEAAFADDGLDVAEVEPYTPPAMELDDDRTAVLNMDDIHASVYGPPPDTADAIDVAEVDDTQEITTFENLDDATDSSQYLPPQPAPRPAPPAAAPAMSSGPSVSMDEIRAEVTRVVGEEMDSRLSDALAKMTADMVERIVWEVVPELAEEIIQKEIDRIKSGR